MVTSILGAVSQFEKATAASKLKAARHRKKAEIGMKLEGWKSYQEFNPILAKEANRLRRKILYLGNGKP